MRFASTFLISIAFLNTLSVFAQRSSRASKLLNVGSLSPEWQLSNSEGKKRELGDYKGKILLMDFWATWCAPCIQAQPKLQEIHEKYSKDVVVLGMDFNDKKDADINAYKLRKKLGYEMILNSEKIGVAYKIEALPTVYLIDRAGRILYAAMGYSEIVEAELISAIESELRKTN